MANYAVSLPRLSALPLAREAPLFNIYSRGYLEENPSAAYQLWQEVMRPSLSQRMGLERLFDQIYRQYQAYSALEGPEAPDWISYLSRLDPNIQLASLTPQLRGVDLSQYLRPIRWFTFS